MDKIEIDYPNPAIGFGANIGFLSFLVNSGKSYRIHIANDYLSSFKNLKEIFQIPDDVIELVEDTEYTRELSRDYVDNLDDNAKPFSRYLTPSTVKLYGQQFKVNSDKRKRYICLAISGRTESSRDIYFDNTEYLKVPLGMPTKLYEYTRKEIDKIISLIIDAGYDIVTLESPLITVEQKVFILNELCDGIIGYEGGMMHLAHVLGVPSIIYPWPAEEGIMKNWVIPDINHTLSMTMHLDKRTYFLDSAEELHSWNGEKFKQVIDGLYLEQGNNKLLQNSVTDHFYKFSLDQQFDAMNTPFILRDILKTMVPLTIGGY